MALRHTVGIGTLWRGASLESAAAHGSRGGYLFRSEQNPNELVIMFEWESLEKAREFSLRPGLREKMQQAGVMAPPETFYLNKVEDVEK